MPTMDLGSGGAPWDPFLSFAQPPEGVYEGKVISVNPGYKEGHSTEFVIDLPAIKMETKHYLGNEPGAKGGNISKWRQALLSAAPSKEAADALLAKMKAGAVQFDPALHAAQTFLNRTVYLMVIAVPGVNEKGQANFPDKEFITRAQYESVKSGALKIPSASAPKTVAPANGALTGAVATPGVTPAAPAAGGDALAAIFGR